MKSCQFLIRFDLAFFRARCCKATGNFRFECSSSYFPFSAQEAKKTPKLFFFVPRGFKMLPLNFCRMSAGSKAEIEFVFLMAIYEILQMHNFRLFGLKFLILLE